MIPDDPSAMITLSGCEVTEIYTNPEIEGVFDWSHPYGIIEMLAEKGFINGDYLVLCNVTNEFFQDSHYGDWDEEIYYSDFAVTKLKMETQ